MEAANTALCWKAPYRIPDEAFSSLPQRLRKASGHLINAASTDINLGNSMSYGLHLLANGPRWRVGDEVLLVQADFSANILPLVDLSRAQVK